MLWIVKGAPKELQWEFIVHHTAMGCTWESADGSNGEPIIISMGTTCKLIEDAIDIQMARKGNVIGNNLEYKDYAMDMQCKQNKRYKLRHDGNPMDVQWWSSGHA